MERMGNDKPACLPGVDPSKQPKNFIARLFDSD